MGRMGKPVAAHCFYGFYTKIITFSIFWKKVLTNTARDGKILKYR